MKSTKNKTVYVPMAADYLHIGHIKIINEAKKHGKVIIGLLTDQAISSYKRVPMTSYEQIKKIMETTESKSKSKSKKRKPFSKTAASIAVMISLVLSNIALGDVPARTWAKLKELGLTTWKKLGEGRYVTLYYPMDKPTTTYYEVS